MKILITGGAGFLGARLARTLLSRSFLNGKPIESLVLADIMAPPAGLLVDPRVKVKQGPLLGLCTALGEDRFDGVFHLASAVSGECEADFNLGMRSNLDTTRHLLDAIRLAGNVPRFVFASSVAVFGGDSSMPLPLVVRDETLPVPQSSYGMHKFVCEQLVADYTRKGYIDGRSARLMTVAVRPGTPNGAASSFISSIVREPLAGVATVCPVPPETEIAIASPANTIAGMIAVFEADQERFGGRTAMNLPALTVRVQEMLDAVESNGFPEARALVAFKPDISIGRIVRGWPARFDQGRSLRLGLRPDKDAHSVIQQYIADHGASITTRRPQ